VAALVALSDGTHKVHSGDVEVKIRPDASCLRALRAHRVLHVRGKLTFQSSLGGPSVAHKIALEVREASRSSAHRPSHRP